MLEESLNDEIMRINRGIKRKTMVKIKIVCEWE